VTELFNADTMSISRVPLRMLARMNCFCATDRFPAQRVAHRHLVQIEFQAADEALHIALGKSVVGEEMGDLVENIHVLIRQGWRTRAN
jgi:hypothetical protein